MIRRSKLRAGFTLLEVMVSMAILAIALGAVFASEAGSVKMATRARKLGWATTLVRCKMGEIEEQIAKEGFPAIMGEGEDKCCKDAEIQGFTCKWQIEAVSMPDTMFNPEEGEGEGDGDEEGDDKDGKSGDSKSGDSKSSDSKSGDGKATKSGDGKDTDSGDSKKKKLDPAELLKDPKKLLGGGSTPGGGALGMGAAMGMGMASGTGTGDDEEGAGPDMDSIASMAMGYIYPILKPSFESQIRRATVTVQWKEGTAEKSFDVTQYLVAEQPIPLTDPNAQDQSGTGSGTPNGSNTAFGTTPQGNLLQPRSFGLGK